MLVARTDNDAPKHQGLTYFLMDMDQPEVQIRPLVQITGEAEFNELFLEGARIPHENIVGGEGNGWAVAITTLMHERATLAFGLQIQVKIALRQLMEKARSTRANGRMANEDEIVRQRLAQLYIESEVLRLNAYRGLTAIMRNGVPGPEGSLGKWQWAEVNQALTELALDIAGPRAAARRGRVDLPLPARPRELDRGRHDRDPQEHRRRARARPAEAAVNFELSDDQQAIKRTARDFLAARYKLEEVRRLAGDERGFTDEQWTEIAELGWPGLVVPEALGGLGLGAVELVVLGEELGYALAPTPFLSTVAAALLLVQAGHRRAARRPPARHRLRRAPRRGRAVGPRHRLVGRQLAPAARPRAQRAQDPRRRRGRAPTCSSSRAPAGATTSSTCTTRASRSRATPGIDPTRKLYDVELDGGRGARARRRRGGHPARLRLDRHRAGGRVGRDRAAHDGDGRRVRQGPQAVRPADRRPTRRSRTAARRCCSRSRARAR